MTTATSARRPSRQVWAGVLFVALYIGYGVTIAVDFWRNLFAFPLFDENVLPIWLGAWRVQSMPASMSQGLPVGYLAPVDWLARFFDDIVAGRLLSTASIVLLGASVWWLSARLGAGRLGRHVAMLAFLNFVLAGHTFFFNAIADSPFTLLMFWVIAGVGVAVVERRMDLAILAGAGLAFAWTVRPLAPVFTLAILGGLVVLVLRDAERGQALRYALAVVAAVGCGVLLAQAPALRASGRLAFEDKTGDPDLLRQQRFLSILRHAERHAGGIGGWLWVPVVKDEEAQRYLAEHGADSLPRGRVEAWRRAPLEKIYQFLISVGVRTTYYLAALTGLLFPLACLARGAPGAGRRHGNYLAFGAAVFVIYLVIINVIASPFIEWRWLMLPAVALLCAGAVVLERLLDTRPAAGFALLAVQLLFLCASCAVWAHRVAIGYPPRGVI